jgi:hypothetical protein
MRRGTEGDGRERASWVAALALATATLAGCGSARTPPDAAATAGGARPVAPLIAFGSVACVPEAQTKGAPVDPTYPRCLTAPDSIAPLTCGPCSIELTVTGTEFVRRDHPGLCCYDVRSPGGP